VRRSSWLMVPLGPPFPHAGFTKLLRDEYTQLKELGQLAKDGVTVQVIKEKGPLGPRQLEKLPMSMLE